MVLLSKQNLPIYSDGQENTRNWDYLVKIFSCLYLTKDLSKYGKSIFSGVVVVVCVGREGGIQTHCPSCIL